MQRPNNENDQVQSMLAALLQLDASGRERWLREHGGDTAVVSRVMELLSLAGVQGSGPDPDAVTTASAPDDQGRSPGGPTPPAPPGRRGGGGGAEGAGDWIGPYKLLEIIGEGGFGTVWLAERRQPMVQRVAVKIIKAGMDTRAVVARFEQERQALAVMNHPNIARVFDAGTTDAGRPYFVMEYVAGEPITRYADRQNLTVRQRLELFIPVCEAVQHAHHKGMIHRDIKPSNILVGVSGGQLIVKVIDFGVAKAISHTLTDHSIFTESGQLIGTPEYMSPEQAEMGATDIDTRTDVYSLGVVLYELLSGLLPFDAKTLRAAGYDAIRKVLREQDAPKPSTRLSTADDATGAAIAKSRVMDREQLARQLRSELDWIPLKALRKDRTQRYDTPVALAKDVQRYLDGEVLEAGPEAVGYRVRKFVRRYRGQVVSLSAVMLALLLGFGTAVWKWRGEREQKREAQAQKAAAEAAQANEAQERQRAESNEKKAKAQQEIAEKKTNEVEERNKTIEWNSYVANIEMAGAALDMRQFLLARDRLDASERQENRGWEWNWLNASMDNSIIMLRGHTRGVNSAAFSRTGSRIFTGSDDGTARVWDARTGKCITVIHGPASASRSAWFSPNGKRFIAAWQNGTAAVVDTTTGNRLSVLDGHTAYIKSASFSADETRVITASEDKTARVWSVATGKCLAELRGHTDSVVSASFSPDEKAAVTASFDTTSRVWDAATGASLVELKGHTHYVNSAMFSPDGTMVVTASTDGTARTWQAATGKKLAELKGHAPAVALGGVRSAEFSPDGTRIVTASGDQTARVWDTATGKSLAELKGHSNSVNSASFGPDGTRVVTASNDLTARLWDAETGTSLAEFKGHVNEVVSAMFSPDGTRIVTASRDRTARVWDATMGTGVAQHKVEGRGEWIHSAVLSPDGTRIATAPMDKTAWVWDGTTGKVLAALTGHTDTVHSIVFSPDGTRIVTASKDKMARVWDAASGNCVDEIKVHTARVRTAAFSPSGELIVTASDDTTAQVWDLTMRTRIAELKGHTDSVVSASFSPDGTRIVTASSDGTSRVWDAATGKQLAELRGHTDGLASASFSPNGSRIVTASSDMTARVWDSTTGTSLFELKGHTRFLNTASYNFDGTRIVTASVDGTARLWDAATGTGIAELKGHKLAVTSASFNPDGARIVTASLDATARVWDVATGTSLAVIRGHMHSVNSASFSSDGTRIVTAGADKTARVWDSVPYRVRYREILRARAAKTEPIVERRLKAGESAESLLAAFANDPALTPEERTAAQAALFARMAEQQANAQDRLIEADKLNTTAWDAVRFAPVTPETAAKALAAARRVIELAPDQGFYFNTLGVALYRASEFKEALDTLTRSDAINAKGEDGPLPGDIAFIAMSHWQLGHKDEARTSLATLRDLAAKERWKDDEETIRHLAEAEALIAEKP